MGLVFAYDFETNGFPLFNEPSNDARQPHIVELGALLIDSATRAVVESYSRIARPTNWTISPELAAIHGISHERALAEGIDEEEITHDLVAMWRRCERRVAHSESFDARIGRIAILRFGLGDAIADEWKAGVATCTMKSSRAIVGLKKAPNLSEAYRFFTGDEMPNGHAALADATAAAAIYFGVLDHGAGPAPAPISRPAAPQAATVPVNAPDGADEGLGFL